MFDTSFTEHLPAKGVYVDMPRAAAVVVSLAANPQQWPGIVTLEVSGGRLKVRRLKWSTNADGLLIVTYADSTGYSVRNTGAVTSEAGGKAVSGILIETPGEPRAARYQATVEGIALHGARSPEVTVEITVPVGFPYGYSS